MKKTHISMADVVRMVRMGDYYKRDLFEDLP
jgi:hypothetical protein